MTDFLIKTLSADRWETYQTLGQAKGIDPAEPYSRNLIYSKELYVILAELEVVVRNQFHSFLQKHFQKQDWMSDLTLFRKSHKEQLEKSITKLSQNKNHGYTVSDLIAELNFVFWVHLLDAPYEQKFWVPCLCRVFPNKFGKPQRADIEARLKNLLRMRNKIAHLEPIIRHEHLLPQVYSSAFDIISWICPKTARWFDQNNQFQAIWRTNNPTMSSTQ